MIFLLCLTVSLNIVILVELCLQEMKRQEFDGKIIAYGRTFLFYLFFVVIIAFAIYWIGTYFKFL